MDQTTYTVNKLELKAIDALLSRLGQILDITLPQEMLLQLRTLALDIETLVPYHDGHLIRVTCYALAIGDRLKLDDKDMLALEIASLLHDFGKVGIDCSMLEKNGRLNAAEAALIHDHAERGYQILSGFTRLEWVASIIRDHHERFDGQGYPGQKQAHAVSLLSRIITVADAYDAMTTSRPYRKRMSHAQAIHELVKFAGIQFDPLVVRTFVSSSQYVRLRSEGAEIAA